MNNKQQLQRQKRIREKLKKNSDIPRLSVFRSNRFIYAQVIDDGKGVTLVGASEKELNSPPVKGYGKIEKAKELGLLIAKKALTKKIKNVAFDKGSYAYHGRVKAVADGAREGGLKF